MCHGEARSNDVQADEQRRSHKSILIKLRMSQRSLHKASRAKVPRTSVVH
jgi:hypothetical protein